jgi:hypothetical protein
MGAHTAEILRDGDLLGRILDTFVVGQMRSKIVALGGDSRLFDLRTEQGRREADCLVEWADGRVITVEAKADAAPSGDAARHLVWLRDRLGKRFVARVVFHTGPRAFRDEERVVMLPICAMWG